MVRVLFSFLTLCIFAVGGVFLYFYSQVSIESNSIIEYKPKLTTRIYDRNGNLVANIFDDDDEKFMNVNHPFSFIIRSYNFSDGNDILFFGKIESL